jgi:hypothetical protein
MRCSEKWSINCETKIKTIYEEAIEKSEIMKEQNDNLNKVSSRIADENKKRLHKFRDVAISMPTRCDNCEKFIFGLYKQSVPCESKLFLLVHSTFPILNKTCGII